VAIISVFPRCDRVHEFPSWTLFSLAHCARAEDAGQPSSEAEVPPNEPAVPDTGR
jgi:hypothetical protein